MTRLRSYIIVSFIAAILLPAFAADARATTINTADFGLSEDGDATPAIRRALDACRRDNATKLSIPKGIYHFYPDSATERFCAISNNDNGLKRIAFPLIGFSDFEIDGCGSEFIFHGPMVAIVVDGSQDIRLKNFSIDWSQPFNFQASIVAVDAENLTIDIEPYKECEPVIRNNHLHFVERDPRTQDGGRLDAWKTPWEQDLRWNILFDEETKAPITKFHSADALSARFMQSPDYRVEQIAENRYRMHGACSIPPSPGMAIIAKGMLSHNRLSPAICLNRSERVTITDVNVYHAGGMGLIGERTEDVTLERFCVRLREGTDRIISTTADATHFVGCRGKISFKDCLFENMLDDATNVHGIYTRVTEQTGPRTLEAKRMHFQQEGFVFVGQGDTLRFSSRMELKPYGEAKVTAVREINGQLIEIEFDRPLEGLLRPDSVLDNLSWQADVEMTGCTIRRNRARSILLSTAGDVVIEKNLFDRSSMMNVLMEGDAYVWHESGPSRNLRFAENRVISLNPLAPVFRIAPKYPKGVIPTEPYHRGVVIENNRFEMRSPFVIDALFAADVTIRGNTVTATGGFQADVPKTAIKLTKCQDVKIENNRFELDTPVRVIKNGQCENITVQGNEGIESD